MDPTANFEKSVLHERIVEHLFIGEALRTLWCQGVVDVEVLHSEFDAGGYDIVMSYGKWVRHIQLKTANTSISLKLMEKPSGCVIWIIVTAELRFEYYLWFGGKPGEPLPDIREMKVAKHPKANAEGIKAEKPNHRIIPRSKFERLETLDAVLHRLLPLA
jgi:hypothetical protein